MKARYRNAFFIFGIGILVLMLTQLDFHEVWSGLSHAGYWFLAVVALWGLLYMFNTSAWYIIIDSQRRSGEPRTVDFWWLYKVTVSGFALNYATPGGLMGGEPYRIMELTPRIGAEKATSSVILYVMTHIFSHFWFWLLCTVVYVVVRPVSLPMGLLLGAVAAFCLLAVWFFMAGYRKGIVVRLTGIIGSMPVLKNRMTPFLERHRNQFNDIDRQVAALHRQSRRTFVAAVMLELGCRVCSALEIMFILRVLSPHADFGDCLLILAFTTLFANMLFFMPLQIGGREGGFLMSATGLGLTAGTGAFVALIVRLRELVWTGVGMLLMKC